MSGMILHEDRSIAVPPGKVVKTSYVNIFKVRLACRDRIGVGDINTAYQRRIQNAPNQPWPCPVGVWDDDTFVIHDGRHEWLAAVAIGFDTILVAWLE